jgi:hypothetical protein
LEFVVVGEVMGKVVEFNMNKDKFSVAFEEVEVAIVVLDVVAEVVVEVGVVLIFLLEGDFVEDVFSEEIGVDVVVMFENGVVPEGSKPEVVVPLPAIEGDVVVEFLNVVVSDKEGWLVIVDVGDVVFVPVALGDVTVFVVVGIVGEDPVEVVVIVVDVAEGSGLVDVVPKVRLAVDVVDVGAIGEVVVIPDVEEVIVLVVDGVKVETVIPVFEGIVVVIEVLLEVVVVSKTVGEILETKVVPKVFVDVVFFILDIEDIAVVVGEVPIVLVPEEDVGDVVVGDIVDEDVVVDGGFELVPEENAVEVFGVIEIDVVVNVVEVVVGVNVGFEVPEVVGEVFKEVFDVIDVVFKLVEVFPDIMGEVVEVIPEVGVIPPEIGDVIFPVEVVLELIGDVGIPVVPKFEAEVFVVPELVGEPVFITVEVLLEVKEFPDIIGSDIFVLFYVFVLLFFYVNNTQFVIDA